MARPRKHRVSEHAGDLAEELRRAISADVNETIIQDTLQKIQTDFGNELGEICRTFEADGMVYPAIPENATLRDCDFNRATMDQVNLEEADISQSVFVDARLKEAFMRCLRSLYLMPG